MSARSTVSTQQPQSKVESPRPVTRELARFAATATIDSIPAPVRDRVRTDALDSLAVGVFGHTLPWVQTAVELWEEYGGAEEARVWGRGTRLPAPRAVQANSHAMNSFEYDDTYVWGGFGTHQGNNVVPAALAVAELVGGVSGTDLLVAMAVGHEIGVRVMHAITKKRPGWNHTALCSTFGSAATAGRLLGLNELEMTWALGSAGVYVGGLLTMPPESNMKQMVNGRMAEGGVIAAILAKRGFTGPENLLEARQGGFYTNHAEAYDPDRLVEGLGDTYHSVNVHTKRFPMCTSVHAPLEAACQVVADHDFELEDVQRIVVRTTSGAQTNTVGFEPTNISSIQMSLAFGVATAIRTGAVLPESIQEDVLDDPEFQALMAKVEPVKDPDFDDMWKGRSGSAGPGMVQLHLADGTVLESRVVPEASRMTNEEIVAKARNALEPVLGATAASEVIAFFDNLEEQATVEPLFQLL